jgi:hypothetical protein
VNRPFGITFGGRAAHHRHPPRQFRRALAAPPVPAPPPQDPPQHHLPVHLLRVLGAQVLVLGAAAAAPPQLRVHVDEPLPGLQVRVHLAAMTRRAPPLSPPARARAALPAVAAGIPAAAWLPRLLLLAGDAEQQAAERRDRLRQMLHLRHQPRHPLVQRRLPGRQLLSQRLGPQRTGTPHSSIRIRRRAERHAPQCTSPQATCHTPDTACRKIPRHGTDRPRGPAPGTRLPRDHRLLTFVVLYLMAQGRLAAPL